MNKMLWMLFMLLSVSLSSTPLYAELYTATQGDVLTIHKQLPEGNISLHCFGKSWPVIRESDGKVWAWIGVDLKNKTDVFSITWQGDAWQVSDELSVVKGKFRISRITVEKKMAVFGKKELKRIRSDQRTLKNSYKASVDATPFIHITNMPTEGIESTPFGAQRYVNGEPRSSHSGIDIAAPEGSPVTTPLAGKVLVVSGMYLNGNTVAIGHGHGLVSVFSHLKIASVKEGEWVESGVQIGEVGKTGRATGPHLHWGLRFNQARINPYSIMRLQEQ
ncbi:MAG: M23 family metallopeptidase [Mariprofundaceae bacterium]